MGDSQKQSSPSERGMRGDVLVAVKATTCRGRRPRTDTCGATGRERRNKKRGGEGGRSAESKTKEGWREEEEEEVKEAGPPMKASWGLSRGISPKRQTLPPTHGRHPLLPPPPPSPGKTSVPF